MGSLPFVHIYTDGSVNKNPGGTGGYAAVLIFKTGSKTVIKEISNGDFTTTNNRMELMGAICGLEALKRPSKVLLLSDSQYVVKGMKQYVPSWLRNGGLEGRVNADLWRRLLKAAEGHDVKWKWIRGHAGIRWNEHADKLAGEAMGKALLSGQAEHFERVLVREDYGDTNADQQSQDGGESHQNANSG